jgi:hypothetical protein
MVGEVSGGAILVVGPEVSGLSNFFFFLSQRRNPDKSGCKVLFATSRLGEKQNPFV